MKKTLLLFVGIVTIISAAEIKKSESLNQYLENNSHESTATIIKDVTKLLEGGADINAQTSQGNTPLITSIMLGREEVAKYLIDRNALLDIKNYEGKTALDIAIQQNMHNIVRMIEARILAYQRPPRRRKPLKSMAMALPA